MGEIVNYMQLDTDRMEYVASSIHVVWDGILQVNGSSIFPLCLQYPKAKYFFPVDCWVHLLAA